MPFRTMATASPSKTFGARSVRAETSLLPVFLSPGEIEASGEALQAHRGDILEAALSPADEALRRGPPLARTSG